MKRKRSPLLAKSTQINQKVTSSKSSISKSSKRPPTKKKKWTRKDIRKHQDKMGSKIPWEEVWEVPGKYTPKEYYNMMDEDSHWELIDNKIIVHSPAGMEHQDIVGSLYTLIRTHVTIKGWGIAYTAPAGLEIQGLSNKFEPDIFAISQEKANYVKGSFCEYVPELVIEVALTKKALNYILEKEYKKFDDYAHIGIQEYLVVYAPKKGNVEYYHYDNINGQFVRKENNDIVSLRTIDLTFPSNLITDRNYWRTTIIDQFLASTVVEKIDPKVRVNGVDPKVRVNGVDPKIRMANIPPETVVEMISQKELAEHIAPKIRVNGVDPKVRVNGVDPKVRVNGVDPKIRVNGVDPKIRVNGVDPKVRVDGLDIKSRLQGMSIEEIKKYIAENE